MKVLLVNSRASDFVFHKMVPLGLLWVAAVAEKEGFEVRVYDHDVEDTPYPDLLRSYRPDVIGITGTTHSRFDSFELAARAKEVLPDATVVYGGCHASFTARDTLEHIGAIDCVVRGEGERTFAEIVHRLDGGSRDFSDLPGLTYRDAGGAIVANPPRPRIADLDRLPLPARHLIDFSKYKLSMYVKNIRGASVMTSRGCPINCSFCSASAMFGNRVTFRSAGSVLDEVEFLLERYKIEGVKFFDSTLTLRRRHIEAICDEFLARGLNRVPWECEIRVDSVSFDLLEKMKEAGCYFVEFGVESASPRVLEAMHKKIHLDQVGRVVSWLKKLRIHSLAFFTYGHIGETPEDAALTRKYVEKIRPKVTYVGGGVGIRIYPGTTVEKHAMANGLMPAGFRSWSEPFHHPDNKFLDIPPDIPVLTQPQMRFADLIRIREKILLMKMFSPRAVFEKLREIRSPRQAVKLGYYLGKIVAGKLLPRRAAGAAGAATSARAGESSWAAEDAPALPGAGAPRT